MLTREELNRQLWGAADILRGAVDASDFKNHILSLLFLKRLSDVFFERREEILREWQKSGKSAKEAEKIAEDPDEYGDGAYYLPAESRWPWLMKVAENRAEAIDKALVAIEDTNSRYLSGVLAGVRFNDERRFGDAATMDGLMQRLLAHFAKIPLGNRDLLEPDVLGNAYEYLIERFAETAGKKGGEFYTPRGVVRLLVELLDPKEEMRIHDPTCGSGGMLIECGHHIEERGGNPRNLTLTGQEKNVGTWAICRLNMLLHGFPDADIRAGDTIRSPKFVTRGSLDAFDRVIANPPFSLKDWGGETAESDTYKRFERGVPPKTKGDMAFLLHMVEAVKDRRGMAGVVLPHGVLFRGGSEARIRDSLLREDLIEAVIGLPAQLFFGTGIPAALVICNWKKPAERKGKILFIDASTDGLYREGKARNFIDPADILRITAIFHAWVDSEKVKPTGLGISGVWTKALRRHCKKQLEKAAHEDSAFLGRIKDEFGRREAEIATAQETFVKWLDESHPAPGGGTRTSLEKHTAIVAVKDILQDHKGNLNITRYVDATDPPPRLDVKAELKKLRQLEKQRDEAEAKMNELLKEFGYVG
jgi:type I restriction enzyme M protein